MAIKILILDDPHLDSNGNINVTFLAYLTVRIKCNVTDFYKQLVMKHGHLLVLN
jgi:hypothetical protein